MYARPIFSAFKEIPGPEVAVKDLFPETSLWNTDAIVVANHGRQIAANQDRRRSIHALAKINQRAIGRVHAIDPLEALAREIELVQGRILDHQLVQIGNELLDTSVSVEVQ